MEDKIIKRLGGEAFSGEAPDLGSGPELGMLLHSGLHESGQRYRLKASHAFYMDHFEFVAPEPVRQLESVTAEFLVQPLGLMKRSLRGVITEHLVYVGQKTGWVQVDGSHRIIADDIETFVKALQVSRPKKWKLGQPLREHIAIFPEGTRREGTVLKVTAAGDRMAVTRKNGVSVGVLVDGNWVHQLCFDFEATDVAFDDSGTRVCAIGGDKIGVAQWTGKSWTEQPMAAPSEEQHGSDDEVAWPPPAKRGCFNACAFVDERLYAVGNRLYRFESIDDTWTCTCSWSVEKAGVSRFPQHLFLFRGELAVGSPPTLFLQEDDTFRSELFAGDEALASLVARRPPIPTSLHDDGVTLLFSSMVFRREGDAFDLAARFAPKKKLPKDGRFIWNALCGDHALLGLQVPFKKKTGAQATHVLFERDADGAFTEISVMETQLLTEETPTAAMGALSRDALFQYFEVRDEIQCFVIP